ncbi:hypothetical protein ACS0TY_013626 [Phlomoides rotata]
MLCQEPESLVRGRRKKLTFLETEVFVSISKSYTREIQLSVFTVSLILWCYDYTCCEYICPICNKSMGNMQVNVLVDNLEIEKLNSINLKAATSAALLLFPSKFCEEELYAKVRSLSYMGDLRMLFAEDKNKSLPPDFLTVLRTDGLLRSLISKLGASQRIRLLTYARCALRGLSSEASFGSATRDTANLLAHEAAFALGQMQDAKAIHALETVLNDFSLHPIVRHEINQKMMKSPLIKDLYLEIDRLKQERKDKIKDNNSDLRQKFQSQLTQQLQILHKSVASATTQ